MATSSSSQGQSRSARETRFAFGEGNALRFRSLRHGVIRPAPQAGLRLASAMCEIDGGAGDLASAAGRITSSFLVSDTGELTEHQVGLVFFGSGVARPQGSR